MRQIPSFLNFPCDAREIPFFAQGRIFALGNQNSFFFMFAAQNRARESLDLNNSNRTNLKLEKK